MEHNVNLQINLEINEKLRALYLHYTPEMLSAWENIFKEEPPCRINEFGIIDPEKYNTESGILFVGRETNGWKNEDYRNGTLFRSWLNDISKNGTYMSEHVKSHPNMWYNVGRWALLLQDPEKPLQELASCKEEAIAALGTVAFTNVNKVRGDKTAGAKYRCLSETDIAKDIIKEEISIIKPKIIVCCGTWRTVSKAISELDSHTDIKLICMNHPAARIGTVRMLEKLKSQI